MDKFVMKQKSVEQEDPVDQENLDLLFVEAFIDMLYGIENIDELKKGTVHAMCSESKKKISNLKRFIDAIPTKTVKESEAA